MKKQYDDVLQVAVLQIIKYEGDISQIAGEYYSYYDIREIITLFKRNGLASDLSGKIEITERGEKYYIELLEKLGMNNKGPIILPQYKYFIRKKNKFDVYFKKK